MQRCTVAVFFRGKPLHTHPTGVHGGKLQPHCHSPSMSRSYIHPCINMLLCIGSIGALTCLLFNISQVFEKQQSYKFNYKSNSTIVAFYKRFWKCNLFPTHCGSDRSAFHNGQPQNYFTVVLRDHEGYISDRKFMNFVLDIYEPPTWLNSTKYCTCTSL